MRSPIAAGLFIFAALASTLHAADAPDYLLTPPQATQLKAVTVLYQTIHTSITAQAQPMHTALADLFAKLKAAHITPSGGPIFIYKTLPTNATDPLDIDIAIPVADSTVPPEGCQSRILASAPTVTSIFKGHFSALGNAYPDFFRQLAALGKTPAGELRERVLYFEDETSSNNILLIEVQVSN